MNIGSICRRQVITIAADNTLQQAALLMRQHHVGALVVTESGTEGPRVAGIISDRDLAIEVLARGGDLARVPVGRIAGRRLFGVPESAELGEAVLAMQSGGVRRLLVHDDAGRLVGLVSFDDILPACVAPLAGLVDALRTGYEREVAERGEIAAPPLPSLWMPARGAPPARDA